MEKENTTETNIVNIENNLSENNNTEIKDKIELEEDSKTYVLDAAFFIKLKPIEPKHKYYTTKFVENEIRDEQARQHYEINKAFITVINPSTDSMKFITRFTKKSNDLFNLSIPDLSVLALAYEFNIKDNKEINFMRNEPLEWKTIKRERKKKEKKETEYDSDGFEVVKSNKKVKEEDEDSEDDDDKAFASIWGENTDQDWVSSKNVEEKIAKFKTYEDTTSKKELKGCFLITDDYTVQNVCLKMGINVISVNGMMVRGLKNFLFKCYTCNQFNFDTTILFCQNCGYNTLMKIGYKINDKGEGIIFDKDADRRVRGTQFDIPKPTIGKRATVYILSEDQMPVNKKKNIDVEKDLEKILENYDQYKNLLNLKKDGKVDGQSTKNYVWGYPKKNPNQPAKYYGKKTKK